jgi:hypothetical protein
MAPKILFIDIETAPKLAYVWRFFKENIGAKQVQEHGHIMSFSALWGDSDDVIYEENRGMDDYEITLALRNVLDDADVVIGQNVQAFDTKTINSRCLVLEIPPPSPYKIVDTYLSAKKHFKFESNSLEYLTKVLKTKRQKTSHAKFPGFELWLGCLRGDPEAWEEMREYNIDDTFATRDVYYAMRPWIDNHANLGLYLEADKHVCPKCGSVHQQRRGYTYTNTGKYQRFRCVDCGGWSRTRFNEYPKEKRQSLLVNAV